MRTTMTLGIVAFSATLLGLSASGAGEPSLAKVINLPCNSRADEDDPHLADGGLTLYFTSISKSGDELRYLRRRSTAQSWPAKSNDIGEYILNKGETRSAFATQGKYPQFLYFAARDKEGKNFDLFVAIKHGPGKEWSAPTPVVNVNTEDDECFPYLSADGKSLYFSRKTKHGWRQLVSTRTGTAGPQGWGEPVKVGLPDDFHHATLTRDGKVLVVQGPLGKDRTGLFRCDREGTQWGEPKPIKNLNHPKGKLGDRSPNLSREGTLLYFASDRPGGKGGFDIYVVRMADLK